MSADTRTMLSRFAVPLGILVFMSIVASLGFRGIFPTWSFVPAAVIGGLGAAAVAVLGRWLHLTIPEVLLVSLVGFVLFGAIAVGGIPSPSNFGLFFDGLLNGWAEVLSSTPPADVTAEFRVLPFSVAWFGVMVGSEVVRSSRTPGLGAVGPVGALVIVMLITLEDRSVAIAQGLVVVVGALLLGFVQQRRRNIAAEMFDDMTIEAPSRRAGLIPAAIMLSVVAVAAPVAGPRLPLAEANTRFDLREFQTPPFDPLRQPSPLVQVKAALQEANADIVMFRVQADRQLDRFPLAVLDHYNSEFWAVANTNGDPSGQFRPVDSLFPVPETSTIDEWDRVTTTIELVGLSDIANGEFDPDWLPLAGWPVSVSSTEALDLRFNRESGTVAVAPEGPEAGLVYEVVSAVPPTIEDVALSAAGVTIGDQLNLAVPQIISFAGDVLEGADVGWEQVEAIRAALVDRGAYDSRAGSENARTGHSLGRLTEFLEEPEQVVGFEEQYAAAAALIARGQGLPARVVVGFQIPEDDLDDRWSGGSLEVVAEDMSAWIEVRFDGIGWLPFDVTPPRDREPEDTPQGTSQREVAVPNPPPDPPPPVLPPELDRDAELEEEEEETDEDDEEVVEGDGIPLAAIAVGVGIASPLVLFLGAAALIILLKRRRTKRRRRSGAPSRRVAGAWHEVVDRYSEVGAVPPLNATPQEFARGLEHADLIDAPEGDLLLRLADDVSTAAYHPAPATDERAEQAWLRSDELLTSLSQRRKLTSRVRSRLNPKPLFRKDPLALEEPHNE